MRSHVLTHEDQSWLAHEEAQLSIDVEETTKALIVRTIIAGVAPEHLEVHVTPDILTIRGERKRPKTDDESVTHVQECYWGTFSRSLILPHPINPDDAEVSFSYGILTVTLKKSEMEKTFTGNALTS